MTWKYVGLRVIAGSAIAIAFFLTTGFGSLAQTFSIGLTVSLGAQAAVFVARRLAGESTVSWITMAGTFAAAAAAAIFVLVIADQPSTPLRFQTVDELMEAPRAGAHVKVHGYVETGSIQRRIEGGESITRFVMHERGKRVAVELRGPVPDTFAERAEVVVTGHVQRAGSDLVVVADELMAKCPSTYNTKDGPRPAAQFR